MKYAVNTKKITDIIELINCCKFWISNNDYRSISNWILNENKDFNLLVIYEISIQIFEEQGVKLTKCKLLKEFDKTSILNIDIKLVLVAKILALFSKKDKLKKGRSIYIPVIMEETNGYENLILYRGYGVLESACKCGIDDFQYLSLFKLKRHKYNMKDKYWFNWLYHASFSPIWSKRIQEHGGYINYIKQTVVFKEDPTDDLMQRFYSIYGLEPDEQKKEIQEKSIVDIKKINNWMTFYKNYRKNGLVEIDEEELEEFDVDGLFY
jgi:hypothetical protein